MRAHLNKISKFRIYTNDETLELFKRYRKGDRKAFELIIKSQQRLVVNLALLYNRKGAPLEDIIQEGNLGLLKATERFDYTQYRSFSNYAKGWILQAISIAMTTMPFMVRLPLNQLARYRKVRKFKENFEQRHGYPPSVTDINIGEEVDYEKIEILNRLPDSLGDLVELYGDLDFLESKTDMVTNFMEEEGHRYLVHGLLKRLKGRDAHILRCYYGIDEVEETLSSIGEKMNLTRERARQILWSSVRKLQDISHVKREEAKIGEMIRIDSSEQIGRVINTKQSNDGTTILVVKMWSGYTTEISVYDTPYHVIKNDYKKEPQPTPKELRKKTQKNTFKDVAPSRQKETKNVVNTRQVDCQFKMEAMVGDRIMYGSRPCIVLEKKTMNNSLRLIVKYDDGSLDNVSNDWDKYRVLKKKLN